MRMNMTVKTTAAIQFSLTCLINPVRQVLLTISHREFSASTSK